jgi:hypothetical protein
VTFNAAVTLSLTTATGAVTVGAVSGGAGSRVSIVPSGATAVSTGAFAATTALTLGGSSPIAWTQSSAFTASLTVTAPVAFGAALSVSDLTATSGSLISTNFAFTAATVNVNGAFSISTGYVARTRRSLLPHLGFADTCCAVFVLCSTAGITFSNVLFGASVSLSLTTSTGTVSTGAVDGGSLAASTVVVNPTGTAALSTGLFSNGALLSLGGSGGTRTWTPVPSWTGALVVNSAWTFATALSSLSTVQCTAGGLTSTSSNFAPTGLLTVAGSCTISTG